MRSRRLTQLLRAAGLVLLVVVAGTMVPGVRHAHEGGEVHHGHGEEAAAQFPAVIYERRGRPDESALVVPGGEREAERGEEGVLLAHGAHSHGGGAAHVHVSVLGVELTLPVAGDDEPAVAVADGIETPGGAPAELTDVGSVPVVVAPRGVSGGWSLAWSDLGPVPGRAGVAAGEAELLPGMDDDCACGPDLRDEGPVPRACGV